MFYYFKLFITKSGPYKVLGRYSFYIEFVLCQERIIQRDYSKWLNVLRRGNYLDTVFFYFSKYRLRAKYVPGTARYQKDGGGVKNMSSFFARWFSNKAVVLPGDIWQCLETFLILMTGV